MSGAHAELRKTAVGRNNAYCVSASAKSKLLAAGVALHVDIQFICIIWMA